MLAIIAGIDKSARQRVEEKNSRVMEAMKEDPLKDLPEVVWVPKHPYLEQLSDYSVPPPESFWDNWPKNVIPNLADRSSWISAPALLELATELDYHRPLLVQWACSQLEVGADIGARNNGRMAFIGENYSTAVEHGKLLADGLADWLSKGLALGPYSEDNIPFTDYRVSPMSVVPKPNGAGRICVDLSAPHIADVADAIAKGLVISVNDSIDKNNFKSAGVSTVDVLDLLQQFGPGVYFSKQDWSDAYKHIKAGLVIY